MPWGLAAAAVGVVGSVIAGGQQAGAAADATQAQVEATKYATDIQKQEFDQQQANLAPWLKAGQSGLNEITALLGLAAPTPGTSVTTPGASTTTRVPIGGSYGALNRNNPIWNSIAQRVADRNAPGGYRLVTTAGQPNVTTTPGKTSAQLQQEAFDKFRADPGYQFSFDQGQQAIDRSAAARGILNSGATAKALDRFGTGLADQEYGNYFARLQSLANLGQTATNSSNSAAQTYANNAGNLALNAGDARASGYINSANAFTNGFNGSMGAINNGLYNYFAINGMGQRGGGGGSLPSGSYGYAGSDTGLSIG